MPLQIYNMTTPTAKFNVFVAYQWPGLQEARVPLKQAAATSWPSCQSTPDCLGVFWTVHTRGGAICPGVEYKETDKCSTVVQTIVDGRIWWKGSLIQLNLDNTSPHWSWKDLLRGICSQHFHCQQVHLWKVNECVFSCHQISAEIGGFHGGQQQKVAVNQIHQLATFWQPCCTKFNRG